MEKATYVPIQIINLSLPLSRFKYAQERHRKTLAEISLEFVHSFALAKEIVYIEKDWDARLIPEIYITLSVLNIFPQKPYIM